MASKTTTANLTLGHLGIGTEVADLDTENSEEAIALRRFHEIALAEVLRDHPWSFAKKYAALGLLETYDSDDDEYDEWRYRYAYPSDCAKFLKIFSGVRNDTLQSKIRYDIIYSSAGRMIVTNLPSAVGVYTKNVTDYSMFPPDFIMAFSFKWALYVPNRLLGGDPFKLKQDIGVMYTELMGTAKKNDLEEQEPDEMVDSEFMRSRE